MDTLRTLLLWASLRPSLVGTPLAIIRPGPHRCLWQLRHPLPLLLLLLRRLLRCRRDADRSGWHDRRRCTRISLTTPCACTAIHRGSTVAAIVTAILRLPSFTALSLCLLPHCAARQCRMLLLA